jgi:GTP cyclohydrolase FolE2
VFYTRRYRWVTEKAKKNTKFVNDFGRRSLMESCNSTDEIRRELGKVSYCEYNLD